jgi:alpha-L-fucosidase
MYKSRVIRVPKSNPSKLCFGQAAAVLLAAALSNLALGQQPGSFGMGPPATPQIVDAAAAGAVMPAVEGPVQPNWDSIRQNYKVPQWFIDAKFGITMHWGLYSVPAYHNEWYEKHMYAALSDWHAQNFGPQDKFGYKDFIPMFTATKFNADQWAQLCKEAGAQYVAPTAEHHDWFSMWNSKVSPWNAVKMGPKQDIIGELAAAVRKQGLKFGICNHSIEHYTFIQPKPGLATDLDDPKYADFYWTQHNDANLTRFLEIWVEKCVELIDQYQPDMIWFDNGVNSRAYDPLKMKVAAYYYNRAKQWGKEVTIDTKDSAFPAGSVLDFEKPLRGPKDILDGVWEVEDPIGSTWGYTRDETFRGPQAILAELCETASKNGNLLLNLSPDGDGEINQAQQSALIEIGKWLQVNGDAIYGTHNWTQFSEDNIRFTVKGDDLYAISLVWPTQPLVIKALAAGKQQGAVQAVRLLGSSDEVTFKQDDQGLTIIPPSQPPCKYAFAFKITGLQMNPPGPPVPAIPPQGRPAPPAPVAPAGVPVNGSPSPVH